MHTLLARMLVLCAAILLHLAHPLGASAQTTSDDDARALALFQSGEVAFGDAHYEAALVLFEEAYALSHRAGLLYNMALCADRLHRDDEALGFFERYLEDTPETAPNRSEALSRRDALRAARALPQRSDVPSHDVTQEAWFWAVIGTGAVLVIGGVITGVVLATQDPYTRGSDGTIVTALTGRF